MLKRILALPVVGLVLGLTGAAPAQAHGVAAGGPAATHLAGGAPHIFTARLSGANEVPPADPDGSGTALVVVRGSQVTFALQWNNIPAPILGHIHRGAVGVNGPVVVPSFMPPVPAIIFALAGTVPIVDPPLTGQILANPTGFYVNLHTTQFPAGAVRGQLHG